MDFVISCWFIIESIVIPDGFLKWFYLSFYIHPFFLIVCQIFLWLKLLTRCILNVIFYPLAWVYFRCFYVFAIFKNYVTRIFSISRSNVEQGEELETSLVVQDFGHHQLIISSCSLHSIPPKCEIYELGLQDRKLEDDDYEASHMSGSMYSLSEDCECLPDICSSSCPENTAFSEDLDSPESCTSPEDIAMNEYIQPVCIGNTTLMLPEPRSQGNEEADVLYDVYTKRMRWFDVLSYERTCELRQLGATSFVMSAEAFDYSNTFSTGNRDSRKRLLKSLESDIELVYVAQSCLSWEALYQQFRKVQSLACSNSAESIFYNSKLAGEFQMFQVLLERFVENEIYEGKRVWNFIKERSSSKSFMQVPQVSGFVDGSNEEIDADYTSVKDMLKVIEHCIEAFWNFMETDNRKSSWKFKWLLSTQPLVEDPRDLRVLADLKLKLQIKGLWLRNLQGKNKCCFRKIVNPLADSQWKEIMFTMIDMKLVSRVIRMNYISSSQLRWCNEKLDSVEIIQGAIKRTETNAMFPS